MMFNEKEMKNNTKEKQNVENNFRAQEQVLKDAKQASARAENLLSTYK